jgi:hypothetical protein
MKTSCPESRLCYTVFRFSWLYLARSFCRRESSRRSFGANGLSMSRLLRYSLRCRSCCAWLSEAGSARQLKNSGEQLYAPEGSRFGDKVTGPLPIFPDAPGAAALFTKSNSLIQWAFLIKRSAAAVFCAAFTGWENHKLRRYATNGSHHRRESPGPRRRH